MPAEQIDAIDQQTESFGSLIGRVAGTIGSDQFATADRAALKRMNFDRAPPLAFYRFAFRHLPNGWTNSRDDWQAILQGMALMAPQIHRPDYPFGRALVEHRYSETRLERLLAADGDTRQTLLLRTVRYLAAQKVGCDWRDIAVFLLTKDLGKRERNNMKIAADYYRNLPTKE